MGTPPVRILQIRLGPVRPLTDAAGRPWRSAIAKVAAPDPVRVGIEGIEGDQVADRRHHGGPQQAVLAYAADHYAAWRSEGMDLPWGAFGENLLVEGAADQDVCIGDVWQLGALRLQVSQPRQPCATLARYLSSDTVVPRIWDTGRGGWYLRVLVPGILAPGPAELAGRPHPGWSVARVLRAFDEAARHPEEARGAAALEHLSPEWRAKLAAKAG
jgi:MOSC domain-containing protein YiiM